MYLTADAAGSTGRQKLLGVSYAMPFFHKNRNDLKGYDNRYDV
jgi:hypothetical protein